MVGAAVVGGLTSVAGSLIGGHQQAQAGQAAANLSRDQYQQTRSDQQPYMQSGYAAQSRLNDLLGISVPGGGNGGGSQPLSYQQWSAQNPQQGYGIGGNMSMHQLLTNGGGASPGGNQAGYQSYLQGFQSGGSGGGSGQSSDFGSLLAPFDANTFNQYKDPGYQFRLQQGTQGLQNSAAASSGALSGAALKDLIGYNQDMASTEYGNAFNRYQTQQGNIFSRLSSIANQGENAAANTGAQGTALAGQAGNALQNAGSAEGASIVGATNGIGNAYANYSLSQSPAGQRALGYTP